VRGARKWAGLFWNRCWLWVNIEFSVHCLSHRKGAGCDGPFYTFTDGDQLAKCGALAENSRRGRHPGLRLFDGATMVRHAEVMRAGRGAFADYTDRL